MMKLEDLDLKHVEALLQASGQVLPDRQALPVISYLQHLLDGLCELSSRDPLTGLANRRAFMSVLSQEIDRVARVGESALLLTVDIDHFKRINDTHGHLAGDMVIRAVARTLLNCIRPMDTVARVGGEEFAVVLPSCSAAFGPVVAERICAAVADTLVQHQALSLSVTVSCGGAYAPPWVRSSLETWLERADRQLYLAKQGGRNRVCIEPTLISDVSAEEKDLLYAWAQSAALMINPADAN